MNIGLLNIILFSLIVILVFNKIVGHLNKRDLENLDIYHKEIEPFSIEAASQNIKDLNENNAIMSGFCNKLDTLRNGSTIYEYLTENKMNHELLNQKKKKTERLTETLLNMINDEYDNDKEVETMLSYRKGYNNQMKKQLNVLNEAYDNVKNTLMNKFQINLK